MRIACVIPLYNNKESVLQVIKDCIGQLPDLFVVDDGSTSLPDDFSQILSDMNVTLLKHSRNLGKGRAILTAADELQKRNFDYMVTIDADGQHNPAELPLFVKAINSMESPGIVIGVRDFSSENVPDSSKFGRRFSNFWVQLETGVACQDTQSGYRAYPVRQILELGCVCTRYNFEIEVLVKGLWGGLILREIPISVTYESPEKRVSHFRPFMDNFRLSLLHTWLVTRRLLMLPQHRVAKSREKRDLSLFLHPFKFFKALLNENVSPCMLGVSAGVSSFLAVLPLLSCHMAVILYVAIRLRLNKVMALAIQNLYMPPFTPFLCIELGYFMRHGCWLREATMQSIVKELHLRLFEWLLGSLVLAPLFGVLAGISTFAIAGLLQRRHTA